jgi:hypothetical protein
MSNPHRVLGQARIKYDGTTLDSDGEATLDIGGPVREAVRGDFQAGGFRETMAESKLEVAILLKSGVRVTDLRNIDNATVTFTADTGQTFIIRNAYVADAISLSGSDGKAKLVFQGPPAEEL